MPEPSATILNVNDHDAPRYIVTRILQSAGFEVVEASSGMETLFKAQSLPDLIVLDVQLPDVSGFEVCRRIKSDPLTRSIAVLHLSASFVGSQDTAFGLEGGADGYLTQPVEPPVLIAHIKALLRMRRAEESAREQAVQWQTTFDALGDGIFLLDKDRRVMQCNQAMAELLRQPVDAIRERRLEDVAPAALRAAIPPVVVGRSHFADEIRIDDRWFRVTTDPLPGDRGGGGSVHVMIDITKRKQAEEENLRLLRQTQESAIRQRVFMRDILSSVTEGKLCLCESASDLPTPLPETSEPITLSGGTLSALRRAVREALAQDGFPADRVADLTTAVSEAGMNAVVHAGGGTGQVFTNGNGNIQVWVQDRGSGIAVDRLPHATLQRGYTTAGTLGHGFKMMLQMADRVWLLTGSSGTTVVLGQDRDAPATTMA